MKMALSSDWKRLQSLVCEGKEWLAPEQGSLFVLRARDEEGQPHLFSAEKAEVSLQNEQICYAFGALTARLMIQIDDGIEWRFAIDNHSQLAMEWMDLPNVHFAGALRENGGECAVVSAYNEGLLVEDSRLKPNMIDPEFPSMGGYMMYPYMVSTPLLMWLRGNEGIVMYVHDDAFGPKGIDFACTEDGTTFRTRLFLGGEAGGDIETGMRVRWRHFMGDWQDGADIYRQAIHLPAQPLSSIDVPSWYRDHMPLVITYPVRGQHDMDVMNPNKLFPYINVMPLVEKLARRTGSKVMVLLMHWEGTAPWAPPYVWPPYGGEEAFRELLDRLHEEGHLLGVYCSGLGYTEQSNLIAEYCCTDAIEERNLKEGFCKAPDQSIPHSRICTGQRSGYDICPKSQTGKAILDEALAPLLQSGVDYIQALDQNHGGGMYFCYAKDHGHPPVPGAWMTQASADLLSGWKKSAPHVLLGCESAAAEPYIADLRLSDNRYELCYAFGKPIPLYAYLYHRYLHNFMGNQVSCALEHTTDALCCRIAYSFVAGDLITLVLDDEGEIMPQWSLRDFSQKPDRETVIEFCAALQKWHRIYPTLFRDAQMVKPIPYDCKQVLLPVKDGTIRRESTVLSTAWQMDEGIVQLFINHTPEAQEVRLSKPALLRNAETVLGMTDRITIAPHSAVAGQWPVDSQTVV